MRLYREDIYGERICYEEEEFSFFNGFRRNIEEV